MDTTLNKIDNEEMSMEDILASIRRYVGEDASTPVSASNPTSIDTSTSVVHPSPTPPMTNMEPPKGQPIILTEAYEVNETSQTVKISQTEPVNMPPRVPTMSEHPFDKSDIKIMSESTIETTASALHKLREIPKVIQQPTAASKPKTTLDDFVSDLVRPMVKRWLDENLPTLVEKMVSKEIARITSSLNQ